MSTASIRDFVKAVPGTSSAARQFRGWRKTRRNLPQSMVMLAVEGYLRTAKRRTLADEVQRLEEQLVLERNHTPRLQRLLDGKITFLDVGARYGPPFHFAQYGDFFDFFLVEPEPEEAARLRAAGYHVIDKALADEVGEVTLKVTAKPGSSSIIEPAGPLMTYRMADHSIHRVIDRIALPSTTIDTVAREQGVAFHAMKFDTQGSETIIMRGMAEARPMVILSEVFTGAIYQQRPTFYDVCADLYDRGYLPYWFRLSRIPPPAERFRPDGRGWPGLPISGDAGFIPDWTRPEGQALILQDDLRYAAIMLIVGLEDVLRFVIEQLDLPNADRIRDALAIAPARKRIAQGNMALKP